MEDNLLSDDEVKDSPESPKSGGKKLKMNDGSSQDSLQDTDMSSKKDENVDSGVSADKSESTSSDDRAGGASGGPSNEVVNAAPSGSNVRALLLNLKRSRCNRLYRKRKTPDRDSDSSRDSDDISPEESVPTSRSNENSASDDESTGLRRLAGLAHFLNPVIDCGDSNSSSTNSNGSSSNTSVSDASYESDSNIVIDMPGDTDSDDENPMSQSNRVEENEEQNSKPPSVLLKKRPKHNYIMLREIINREMGLTFPCGKATKADIMFEQRFYGSLHAIYRMKKLHNLNKHRGCVNSINFHPEGHLLASGSDDTNIVVWDWARNIPIQTIKTGHKSNVFQSKFLHLNAQSQLNIVTCARDGQVRLLQCHPSGGTVSRRKLLSHGRAAHKLHVCADEPHRVVSAGEDGLVLQCDVRADGAARLLHVRERGASVPLYSVSGHAAAPHELLLAGRDPFVRLYDTRNPARPRSTYCPAFFNDHTTERKKRRREAMYLTCAVYNHDGTEILGSYNDEDIYLFDTKNDVYDKDNTKELKEGYTHRYGGHRNSATFKGVAFFGPRSEFVVSGSDCSYIYIWEKKTEAIVQWLPGDMNGVVNCIEAHPRCPVLATSGLDKDVKIWVPRSQYDPTYEGLEKVVRENDISQLRSPLFNDFLPTLYSAWRGENQLFSDDGNVSLSDENVPFSYTSSNIEFDGNVCTMF